MRVTLERRHLDALLRQNNVITASFWRHVLAGISSVFIHY